MRRRLDLQRPVPRELLLDCVRLAQQAPTPSNTQTWRFVIVQDAATRAQLAALYRLSAVGYLERSRPGPSTPSQARRVHESAAWLTEHLAEVPVHVIPCVERAGPASATMSSLEALSLAGGIFPAVWSFQLALRARGLGSTLTTLHLPHAAEAAELLGIPDHVIQVALLPVGYTTGGDFSPARRPPPETIVHWDRWRPPAAAR